jgi:6-phosphogluconolactonase
MPTQRSSSPRLYVVGRGDKGQCLYHVDISPISGALTLLSATGDGAVSPFHVVANTAGTRLYVADIRPEFGGLPGGAVQAYAIDSTSAPGTPVYLNGGNAVDTVPCFVCLTRDERHVLAAGYGGGHVTALEIEPDGRVGRVAAIANHADPVSPAKPRAHSVILDPTGTRAVSADLGVDRVMIYHLDSDTSPLTRNDPPFVDTRKGAGPRHLAWHPAGRFLYAMTEYDNTVVAFDYDPRNGRLTTLQVEPALPPEFTGKSYGADIQVHPSGRFLYASNRGHESIVMYEIAPGSGRLTLLGYQPCGGAFPNSCRLTPSGDFLVVTNTNSDNVVSFRVDTDTGRLSDTGHALEINKPTSLCFV